MQGLLPFAFEECAVAPFKTQLLKWIGSKQRFAHEIVSYFPGRYGVYYEPFLGSGAVLATLAPNAAVGSDVFRPLIEIWQTLRNNPDQLVQWYESRYATMTGANRREGYEAIKASYNSKPNPADLLFLCRACYGGVVRFRKADGYMSTPCGVHEPIAPRSFARRVELWRRRTKGAKFLHLDYREAMARAGEGDLVYCDPPYSDTQAILYGAQAFKLAELYEAIARCKARGARVALSIDGTKASGARVCAVRQPPGLFVREVYVNCGRSMLRRFQMSGQTLESEVVADRLLLTY